MTASTAGNPIVRVAIVAIPASTASSLFGLRETLNSVGVAFETFITKEPAAPRFDVFFVGTSTDAFACVSGVEIRPEHSVDSAPEADIVVSSGMVVPITDPSSGFDPRMVEWVAAQHAAGKQVVSSCSGALLLAEAGLLDGKEATTHWVLRDLFRTLYPQILLRLERNLCCADREHRVVTTGGATAWQELAL